MTEPVFVDGRWQTPQLCDDCIIENASRPLSAEQSKDFARVTKELRKSLANDSRDLDDRS
jgi:hypothetical protein